MERSHLRTPNHGTERREGNKRSTVLLDPYVCDLNLNVDRSGYVGTPLTNGGFAYLWGGVRATHGFKSGQVCFAVQILENLDSRLPEEEPNPNILRVGFSCKCTSLQLGEEPLSWGYGGTGKTSFNGEYTLYGSRFSEGDTVTAFLDFQWNEVLVSFAVNGINKGIAHRISKSDLNGRALFPHVLTKNCSFQVNFGETAKFVTHGFENFVYPNEMSTEQLERGYSPPRRKKDCEVLMMCGLPGSGKTTWVQRECMKHPEKNYNVLGTDTIMNNMKVFGLEDNYSTRFKALYTLAENCLNKLLEVASRRKRNYILDQTNVYASARERKISKFPDFHRVAVVVVQSEQVYLRRLCCQKEGGKIVPEDAISNMKANFCIPSEDDIFDEVRYTDLQARNAQALVSSYNQRGRRGSGTHRSTAERNLTSSMATLSVNGTSPASSGTSRNPHQQGGRGFQRGGSTQRDVREVEASANQNPDRQGHRGRFNSRKHNNRGRGPQRAVSTSALNDGIYQYTRS